jgi:hypothetical protein
MGRAAGLDFVENTLWPHHFRLDAVTRLGGTGTFNQGDVFTIAACSRSPGDQGLDGPLAAVRGDLG